VNSERTDETLELCSVLSEQFTKNLNLTIICEHFDKKNWIIFLKNLIENQSEFTINFLHLKSQINISKDSDIWYFTDPETNLSIVEQLQEPKGLFLFKMPFSIDKSYEKIVKLVLLNEMRVFFVDQASLSRIKMQIVNFLTQNSNFSTLMNDKHIASIIYENMQGDFENKHGIILGQGICTFILNILNFTRQIKHQKQSESTDNQPSVQDTRLESLQCIQNIGKKNIRVHKAVGIKKTRYEQKDDFSILKLQLENDDWSTTKMVFSAGCYFNRIVNRTILKIRRSSFEAVYKIFYKNIIFQEEKETIVDIQSFFKNFQNQKFI
ncbi:Glucose-6-phosphate 1-dehydrogenase, partial [Pseudoloma neurophilia]